MPEKKKISFTEYSRLCRKVFVIIFYLAREPSAAPRTGGTRMQTPRPSCSTAVATPCLSVTALMFIQRIQSTHEQQPWSVRSPQDSGRRSRKVRGSWRMEPARVCRRGAKTQFRSDRRRRPRCFIETIGLLLRGPPAPSSLPLASRAPAVGSGAQAGLVGDTQRAPSCRPRRGPGGRSRAGRSRALFGPSGAPYVARSAPGTWRLLLGP